MPLKMKYYEPVLHYGGNSNHNVDNIFVYIRTSLLHFSVNFNAPTENRELLNESEVQPKKRFVMYTRHSFQDHQDATPGS